MPIRIRCRNKSLEGQQVIDRIGFIVPSESNPTRPIRTESKNSASYADQFNYCWSSDRSDWAHARIKELRMEYGRPIHI